MEELEEATDEVGQQAKKWFGLLSASVLCYSATLLHARGHS